MVGLRHRYSPIGRVNSRPTWWAVNMRQKQLFATTSAIFVAGGFLFLTGCSFGATSKSEPAPLAQSLAPTPAPTVQPTSTPGAKPAFDARIQEVRAELRSPNGLDTTNPAVVTDPEPASLTPDETAVREMFYTNFTAVVLEDVEAMLQTMSPACPGYAEAVEAARQAFRTYDFSYQIEEGPNINVRGNEASVEVVQVTRRAAGPEFRNNRTRFTHSLVKEEGGWKMSSTSFDEIEYLN